MIRKDLLHFEVPVDSKFDNRFSLEPGEILSDEESDNKYKKERPFHTKQVRYQNQSNAHRQQQQQQTRRNINGWSNNGIRNYDRNYGNYGIFPKIARVQPIMTRNFLRRQNVRENRNDIRERLTGGETPIYIPNLQVSLRDNYEYIAREIAKKLKEDNFEVIYRTVRILGKELSIEFFKQTQRTERRGGMMILSGKRRRTPGGVFMFLIKDAPFISQKDKDIIFSEDAKGETITNKPPFKKDDNTNTMKKTSINNESDSNIKLLHPHENGCLQLESNLCKMPPKEQEFSSEQSHSAPIDCPKGNRKSNVSSSDDTGFRSNSETSRSTNQASSCSDINSSYTNDSDNPAKENSMSSFSDDSNSKLDSDFIKTDIQKTIDEKPGASRIETCMYGFEDDILDLEYDADWIDMDCP